ncbi:hypothetical protein BJX76DRAFT_346578 [Aspergillus varians]
MADYNLSQTLSARCFLPNDQTRVGLNALHPPQSDAPLSNSGKRRGRPRMAPTDDSPRMDRRAQIRCAQRTYRHKKEAMYSNMETRLAELERNMSRLSESIADFHDMAIESDLHITHPRLYEHLRVTHALAVRATGGKDNDPLREGDFPGMFSPDTRTKDTSSFGYIVNDRDDKGGEIERPPAGNELPKPVPNHQDQTPLERSQVERPINGSTNPTSSLQEPDSSRTLQRYYLEHIYRLLSDPRSDPGKFHRVFRLVAGVKYKEKMGISLLCLVRSGASKPSHTPDLPFYCIGRAGAHCPQAKDGKTIDPGLPSRALGTVVNTLCSEDEIGSIDRKKLLRLTGLDGTWLDGRDVIGYLQEKAVLDRNVGPNPRTRV